MAIHAFLGRQRHRSHGYNLQEKTSRSSIPPDFGKIMLSKPWEKRKRKIPFPLKTLVLYNPPTMKTQNLGTSKLISSRLSFGNMRCVGTWNPAEATPQRRAVGVKSHIAAYEAGYTLFD